MSNRGRVVYKKFTCPAIYGRYPHPQSCEYYFECRFGRPTMMHCNRGHLYDEAQEKCRDRRRVRCRHGGGRDHDHHRDHKDKELEVKEDIRNFKCPYIWGTFAHPSDCSKYFLCLYNFPKLFQCNNNYLYDDKYRKCLPKNRVDCGKRLDRDKVRTSKRPVTLTTAARPVETTKADISITTESRNKFHCPFLYGRYPDPEDCTRYYECRFSVPRLQTCPESTLYDERKEQCREKKKVKCGDRPGGNDDDVVPEENKKENFHCPYIWGTFSHPTDCSKYIVCIYNVPTVFNCRTNQLFDSYRRTCLPKHKVTCDDKINPDEPLPRDETTVSPVFSTLTPGTVKEIPLNTTIANETPTEVSTTNIPTTVATKTVPTTIIQTKITTLPSTTTTPVRLPTTASATTPQPTATTVRVPSTVSTTKITITPAPTTTTTRVPPTTISTTRSTTTPAPTTANRVPTTVSTTERTTTPAPTTTTGRVPTTVLTTKRTTTPAPPTTTTDAATTDYVIFGSSSASPVTKPNTPPPTDCNEDDLECIIDGTGDVAGWFECPKRFGHFPHGSSRQLFIHCDNWRPFVKKCADETFFSPEYLVCVWADKRKGI